jgi:putative transcriptional regulator
MTTYLDGKLLIAPPKMTDWRFAKSVLYVWKHDITGAGGIIVNKKVTAPSFDNICAEGNIHRTTKTNPPIYYGGPVMTNLVGCLHTLDYRLPTTNVTPHQIGFTLDKQIIDDIAMDRGPKQFLLTMGVSSWNAGQLDDEIESLPPRQKTGSWLNLDYDKDIVFGPKVQTLWNDCVEQCVINATQKITKKVFKI